MKLTPLYPQLTDPLEQRANIRLALEDFANVLLVACQWAEKWQCPVFEYGAVLFNTCEAINKGDNWTELLESNAPFTTISISDRMDELRDEILVKPRAEILTEFLAKNPKPMTQLELEKKLNGWQS